MLINTTPSLHKPQSINMPPQPPPSRRPRSSWILFLVLVLLPFLAHAFTPLPSLARYPFSGQAPTPRATHHLSSLATLSPLRSSLRIGAASGRFVWMGNCIHFLRPVLSSSLSSPPSGKAARWGGLQFTRCIYTCRASFFVQSFCCSHVSPLSCPNSSGDYIIHPNPHLLPSLHQYLPLVFYSQSPHVSLLLYQT